ncbi:MAG: SDR family oxidoreductase [Dehalococcoidales bacterium]|jgi:dTDP-glucose 4,6-dehydratase|nr:SDR family oxidoreductase [Dehalococcoidales bacterium]MDP7416106.1 SDR family oxidoreductase [Dehalococcoidales bacterium]
MNVLITGAAGFIGSHLSDKFISEGHRVTGLDNYLTGSPDNLEHLRNETRFKFIEQDITQPFTAADDIDLVMHFASPASPKDYLAHPMETMKAGSTGTRLTLELARGKKSRYLMASTSEIYGDPTVHPQGETYRGNVNTLSPRAVYDEAKRFSETICLTYYREFGLDARIARIFNTYGERMQVNDGRVVPTFLTQALKDEPITVYGDGTQTRSLCYISDLVEGLYHLTTLEGLAGTVVNLGNPDELQIIEVANLVRQLTGSRSGIVFQPLPEDDPKRRCPDIIKAKRLLNWQPEVSLNHGLEKTARYFERILNINKGE